MSNCVCACNTNPPACLEHPGPKFICVGLCRVGARGQPPRERLQDAVVGSNRVRSAHDQRARRQLQGEGDFLLIRVSCSDCWGLLIFTDIFTLKTSLLMLKYQHVMFCHTLNLSCLSRQWPEMRRTTIRTRPNRSGGKLESTDDATQNNSTHLWSRWVSPGQWTCRGYPVVSVWTRQRGSLRRVWGWRGFKHPGWTLMSKETKPVCSQSPLFRLKLKFPL